MVRRASPYRLFAVVSVLACFATGTAQAVEGMWTPEQLPEIERDMRKLGLKIPARDLTDLTSFPFAAVISLGGCTASFVSPQGLVVTNHHCARGSIQFNSSEESNYLRNGFLAASRPLELKAAPGTRVYVTTNLTDVTERVTGNLPADMPPRERYQAIEDEQKRLIAECEAGEGFRCQVKEFYGGATYTLIERLEIRDVRLVYAPGDSVGKYGGDIDNWLWPRHTGDFAFYRAYVGPDGAPADHSEDNVPFEPKHFLEVSRRGLEAGEFVMAAGYPGTTNRYARLSEVEYAFDWAYPNWQSLLSDWVATIEAAAPAGSDSRIKYESRLAGLNNFLKNIGGQLEGARRVGLKDRRAARENRLNDWARDDAASSGFADVFVELDYLAAEISADAKQDFWYTRVASPQLLRAARRLYRLSREKEKPDTEREPGYQERDERFLRESMQVIDRRYAPEVDLAEWLLFIDGYRQQPVELRSESFDAAIGLTDDVEREALESKLSEMYAASSLDNVEERLAWMERPRSDFESSEDPFIKLAVELYDFDIAEEEEEKALKGRMKLLRPAYMDAIITYSREAGQAVYPDANGSLRVTYGTVFGGSPKDGLIYEPFTRLEGIAEKATGEPPFDAPEQQLALIAAADYGNYALDAIGSVPVNFLTDLDSTGGNSGSATLDGRGNLVGLLFDGTIESVNSDWDFDPRTTRSIHVDSRYMLWVMEKLDGAGYLLEEMSLATSP